MISVTTGLAMAFSSLTVIAQQACLECHSKVMDHTFKHADAEKNCSTCHKPNGRTHPLSGEKGFTLVASMPELCYSCHGDIRNPSRKTTHPHLAMTTGKNCLNCHSPHSSADKNLLIYEETKTCLACHNTSATSVNRPAVNIYQLAQSSTYSHAGISKSGCSCCHMPHGSPNPHLLQGTYREDVYTTANKENFLVCFTCHNGDLLLEETTRTATGFRDGDKNLHYLHIQGSKTRTCTSCHNVHGSMNPYLVAEKVPFGKWEMPVQFKSASNGGSCTPGCHSEKSYKR